jgi:hypothetical protein
MFVAGIGIGPTFAVFTIVVQNSVPVERLGAATSNLTLFQSVGGTVGLAITGTIFASVLRDQTAPQMVARDVPEPLVQQMTGSGAMGGDQLTAVGDLGATILAGVPEQFRAQVEPFIDAIVGGIHEAVSLATANTFLIGIVAAVVAAGVVLLMRESPRDAPAPAAGPLYTEQVGERPE